MGTLAEIKRSKRRVIAFSRIEEFYDELMGSIHRKLEANIFKKPFTIILNTRPRNHDPGTIIEEFRFDDFNLIYAGITMQRELLEAYHLNGQNITSQESVRLAWESLEASSKRAATLPSTPKKIKLDTETAIVSSLLQDNFLEFSLKIIQKYGIGFLKNYFFQDDGVPTKGLYRNEEYTIITNYLGNVSEYNYVSLPLIQFAEFDGVAHIIYHKSENNKLIKNDKLIKSKVGYIITEISRSYEFLMLDWELGKNEPFDYRARYLLDVVAELGTTELSTILSYTPIFKELKYQEYYRKNKNMLLRRIIRNAQLPPKILDQYRRIAIMSILIDSYTHNISAHSLVALEGWFHQRAIKHGLEGELRVSVAKLPIILREQSFDLEVQRMLDFLLDRGAFWTGLTRDYSFGGEVVSIFKLLWQYFINNPLYLGTIAYTEGILKLKIRVTILEQTQAAAEGLYYSKKVILDDNFIVIDLTQYDDSEELKKKGISGFIQKGDQFDTISAQLEEMRVFLPGGVVGRHAFFTILENEIRNVKHFPKTVRDQMITDGLTLNISIEEAYINTALKQQGKPNECFLLGVWLKHPTRVSKKLITDRLEQLWGDIILQDTYTPRLGGTSQDKVCTSMLFNNSFKDVQKDEYERTERDLQFYPWLKAGYSPSDDIWKKDDIIQEWVFSARRVLNKGAGFEQAQQAFTDEFKEAKTGYYKKFFHLWKGAHVHTVEPNTEINREWENLSRFQFLHLAEPQAPQYLTQFLKLRQKGIIRIINQHYDNPSAAYYNWLSTWLKQLHQQELTYVFVQDGAFVAVLRWDGGQIEHHWDDSRIEEISAGSALRLNLAHGNNDTNLAIPELRYRNHGILMQYFCQNKGLDEKVMLPERAAELLEILATRICIYDNRVAERIEGMNEAKMQSLGCVIRREEQNTWESERDAITDGFLNYHFLVIHLSFIETFVDEKGEKKYTEDTVDEFFKQEILKNNKTLDECPSNFLLVVTSGRGRSQWLSSLGRQSEESEQNLLPYVTFRPVESLIGAVSAAMDKMDDFELKYQLCRILFGS